MAAAYLKRMGERIRERREELGLSRADVARAMPGKTNENAIYRWEKGQHRPNDDALEALAKALDVNVAYFHADDGASVGTTASPMDGLSALIRGLRRDVDEANRKLDLLLEQDEPEHGDGAA